MAEFQKHCVGALLLFLKVFNVVFVLFYFHELIAMSWVHKIDYEN